MVAAREGTDTAGGRSRPSGVGPRRGERGGRGLVRARLFWVSAWSSLAAPTSTRISCTASGAANIFSASGDDAQERLVVGRRRTLAVETACSRAPALFVSELLDGLDVLELLTELPRGECSRMTRFPSAIAECRGRRTPARALHALVRDGVGAEVERHAGCVAEFDVRSQSRNGSSCAGKSNTACSKRARLRTTTAAETTRPELLGRKSRDALPGAPARCPWLQNRE